MEAILIAIFVLGYAAIALAHPLKINKAASAAMNCHNWYKKNWLAALGYIAGAGAYLLQEQLIRL